MLVSCKVTKQFPISLHRFFTSHEHSKTIKPTEGSSTTETLIGIPLFAFLYFLQTDACSQAFGLCGCKAWAI
ncbi:MAG TPA: hypothetical protein DCQ26_07510 [Marinilabiliales bacterium]|nr:MAG: hypothetical protein A2W84_02800 [Bacteroidetes bacterium GWC2_40_13]OFX71880.1 MAG: hypothetical protein A2W96_06515 [Bacteroidetes bacterium GWD2_40_43]OFX94677.1 MAG: hypothetical protein A2W97_18320 [Bacteroidetes bacterium GWE2_40_63]OFY24794.1 MAG: hypothetical protein A2W88_16995 [Bacteroidetes bacterium GWF2_40_13]OFZ24443.1 MAG: hypothetical protein A2437_18455 [Bacteroidetes bacterium RIFOXYC2_FULL_40_12]HAM98444.1 hypothetical protein [Marinilabiliales bacterium]